ncbi:MAG: hypothetical protein GY772_31880 [bacterium]|nr:hypothetical protein [bacterium]
MTEALQAETAGATRGRAVVDGAIDPDLLADMAWAQGELDPLGPGMEPARAQRSHQLFYILAMLREGRAQDKVANTAPGNGLELWRQLCLEYEPRVRSRQAGLLQQVFLY